MDICPVSGQKFYIKTMKKQEFLTEYKNIIKEVKLNKFVFFFLLRNQVLGSIKNKIMIAGKKEFIKKNALLKTLVGLFSNLFDHTLSTKDLKDLTFKEELPGEVQEIFIEALNNFPYEIKNHFFDLTQFLDKDLMQVITKKELVFYKKSQYLKKKKHKIRHNFIKNP
jgi:hypothetical protein